MAVRKVLIHGDCMDVLARLPEGEIDACVTDPPYHFGSIVKRFAKSGGADRPESRVGAFARHAKGFMGKEWDGGDIAMRPETWEAVFRVLKPGGHLVAFGGTRTHHRVWCAIEDAGFEIRDTIMWLYGSGFPKSHDAGDGWGTALKPAWEPILLARKPLIGTVAQNMTGHGTGAINIDDCRVPGEDETLGRWPANVIHDGSDEVSDAFPQAVGQIADASSSSSRKTQNVYGDMKRGNGRDGEPSADSENEGSVGLKMKPGARRGDVGSAARFFYCAKASRADRDEDMTGDEKPLLWSAGTQNPGSFQSAGTKKAAKNNHPTVKPTDLMRYLCRLVTPAGGTVLDPFMGSGSTGKAAALEGFGFIGIEKDEEYIDIARQRVA